MRSRSLWIYAVIALVLGALTALEHFTRRAAVPVTQEVLPNLKASAVHSVTIYLGDQPEIRVERTNGVWQLARPLAYPAQAHLVEAFLAKLEKLVPAASIEPGELKNRPRAEEDFGFKLPLASITVEQPDYRAQIVLGARTAPGDQVFMKVVGQGAVHVVDAGLLQLIPRSANDLRDTSLLTLRGLEFNRLAVNSGPTAFELEKIPGTGIWRMIHPLDARADTDRVNALLQRLEATRVARFVTDDPKADLDPFGLQSPELEILLKLGTNVVAGLRVGRSPTNDPQQVFAKAQNRPAVVTAARDEFSAWRGSVNDFRSRRLVGALEPVAGMQVDGEASFSIQITNGSWRVLPFGWPADQALLTETLSTLASMHIAEFTKDVVTPADLPNFGLAAPSLKLVVLGVPVASTNSSTTNKVLVDVVFGTNQNDRVYARRADETSVYTVTSSEFLRLPRFPVQFRDRQVWELNVDDVASVSVRRKGRTRQLLRKAAHEWSLAPGSQGIINELAIEESLRALCRFSAAAWIAVGDANLARYGFSEESHQVTISMKNGAKHVIDFGAQIGTESALAAVKIGDETWILEMPGSVYRFVETYLNIPPGML